MIIFKIFASLSVIVVSSCESQIPEKYKNAKPISAHPRYQEHPLNKNFPNNLNNNLEISPLIVGGQPANRGQFPHHAVIFIVYPDDMYLCGGSIIDRNWILTAGHCAYGGAEYFEIYTGIVSFDGPFSWAKKVYPNDVVIHQEYDDNTLNNDIAMIRLVDAPEDLFSDPFIAPISLPTEISDLENQNGTAIGFGRESDSSSSVSRVLKFNSLKALNNEICARYYLPGLVRETNLCAETNSQASTCSGDSGGSYIFNINGVNRLEGVTSFGAVAGCQLGYPSGFSRVTSYLDWINYNINARTTTEKYDNREDIKKILQDSLKIGRNKFG